METCIPPAEVRESVLVSVLVLVAVVAVVSVLEFLQWAGAASHLTRCKPSSLHRICDTKAQSYRHRQLCNPSILSGCM